MFRAPRRSGKLTVTDRVLGHWREGGHKALVFTQTQQMLDIVEKMVVARGYAYHRMDGSTSVAVRRVWIALVYWNCCVFLF